MGFYHQISYVPLPDLLLNNSVTLNLSLLRLNFHIYSMEL
jgi:hypothetical protein